MIANLSADADVDGHDVGAGEVNIFIHTDDAKRTFDEARAILADRASWASVRAAFRELEGEEYMILHPEGLEHFDVA